MRARERLQRLQQHVRIRSIDAQGRQYIMSEGERAAAIAEAQQRAEEFCP